MKTISFLALVAPASAAVYQPGRLVSNANPAWWRNTNLRECQGDCDHDRNCARGLKCWQRNYYDAVPGCTGSGGRHWDYCYDPQKKATREAMTKDYTHLANFGATPIGVNLGKCVGDCDLDGHCKSGLKCFKRSGNEKIPGCLGSATSGYDFCYNPADLLKEQMAKDHSSLKDYGWTPIGNTLGKCVGDCDHNGHCRGGLKCWHRDANERVPGCSGRAVSILDYCYDPKDLAANHNSLVNFGWTPSGAPMGECAGDCDHNGHCTGSLICQQRDNYEKVSGCSGNAEYGVDYCVKPTKNPTKSPTKKPTDSPTASPTESPTKNPTESPTKNPTASPTLSPTERCDANNCMNWSCLDWCECYDEAKVNVYETHEECQDDNDDTCICFDNEEHELHGERHRKINYNQDAVDAGTAKMIEGTNVHTATKQNHFQKSEAPTMAPTVCGDSGIISGANSKPIIKKETVPGQGGGTTDVGRWESTDPTLGGRMGQSWDTKHASMTPSDQTFYYDTRPTRPFQASFELHQECTTHQGGMKQTFKLNPEQEYTLKFDCCTTSSWPTRTVFVSADGMYTRHLIQCNKVSGGKCERKELKFTTESHWNNEQVDREIVFFTGKNECVFIDDIVLETCQ